MSYFKTEREDEKKKERDQTLTDTIHGIIGSAGKEPLEKPKLPDAPEYDRAEVPDLSEEEMREQAENKLHDYVESGKNSVEKDYEAGLAGADKEEESNAQRLDKDKGQIDKLYSEYKKNVENDVLKRGLARSSIAVNRVAEAENERAGKLSQAQKDFDDGVAALEKQRAQLDEKRRKALNDFNLGYAVKLANEIDSISEELYKKKQDALKYNNDLTGKEYGEAVDKTMKESDLYSEKLSQAEKENQLGESLKDPSRQLQLYNKIAEQLSKADKDEAKELINDDALLRENLSEYYYYKLYDKYAR